MPPQPSVRLLGTPHDLDIVFRPLARLAGLLVGGFALVALLIAGQPYWAPVPLAAMLMTSALMFWWRGDRAMVLTLADEITVHDRKRGGTLTVPTEHVHAVTVHYREAQGDRREVVVVLAARTEVLLAMRFLVEPDVRMPAHAVNASRMDLFLGGYGGLVVSVAPPEARCRQTFDDPRGLALSWLLAHLPTTGWSRRAARVWRGEAPDLDPFGLHIGAPSALLVLEADTWSLRGPGVDLTGVVTVMSGWRTRRTLQLLRRPEPGEADDSDAVLEDLEIPVLVVELDEGVQLAMPAPVAGLAGGERDATPTLLHCHVAEGGALIDALLQRWPQPAWPSPLGQQARNLELAHAGAPGGHRVLPTTSAS